MVHHSPATIDMPQIAIVTDSSSSLSADLIARYDLHVLPYYIVAGGRMLRDGIQISRDEVFRLLRDGRHLPNTKAPTRDDFAALFRSLLGKVDAAVVVLPSRERTAAYQHAEWARQGIPELPIALIDSRYTSAGQALVVLAAARAREAGDDFNAVVAAAQQASAGVEFWIVLESLEFAARSGRVPNIDRYRLATHIHSGSSTRVPVLRYENGAPHVTFTARGIDQAVERLKEELKHRVRGDRLNVAIAHAGDMHHVEPIRAWVEKTWSPVELNILDIPPIIAVYSGPGALGIAAYDEDAH